MLLVISHRKWKISGSTKLPSSEWLIVVITMLLYGNCSLCQLFLYRYLFGQLTCPYLSLNYVVNCSIANEM